MSLSSFWHERPERERSALGAGLVVVAVMLVVALVWLPLERTRARLAAELPQLRASVIALERDAREARRLQASPPTIPPNPSPLAMVMRSNDWARELPGVQISVPDEKHVRLRGDDLDFSALVAWLATALQAHGLRVESARIEALRPGRVSAELNLARS